MSLRAIKWRRRILHAWLWRSQPSSPLKNEEKAFKILVHYYSTIVSQIERVGWKDKIEVMPKDPKQCSMEVVQNELSTNN